MIPKFRAWDDRRKRMSVVDRIYIDTKGVRLYDDFGEYWRGFSDVILMQSTGLKDKNEQEIFEGDVVRMRNPRDKRQIGMFRVLRVANSPTLGLLDKKLTTEIFSLYEHMSDYYEVKGNIYENPELLEVDHG